MLNRVIRGVPLLALMAGACTMENSGPDPKLVSDLSYIKIVNVAPSEKCRYLGEALSFRMLPSKLGVDVFNVEGGSRISTTLSFASMPNGSAPML